MITPNGPNKVELKRKKYNKNKWVSDHFMEIM